MRNIFRNFIKEAISLLLTQETGNKVSTSIFKFKNRHKWIFKLLYGTADDEDIFKNILQRLNGEIEILMIHSSFNQMIPMYTGNPVKLLSIIKSYCLQHNITLVMPAFFDGSNSQAKEHYQSGKNIFDVRKTISETGILTEVFRRSKDVKRSIHPTHSICALGPLSEKLTQQHHLSDTTCGEGTPFGEMIKHKTIILGIGTHVNQALTQVHSIEDIMKDKFPLPLFTDTLRINCIDEVGNNLFYNLRIKNPDYVIDLKSFFKLLKRVKIMEWTYKGIPFFITEAKVVTDTLITAANNGQTIYKKRK